MLLVENLHGSGGGAVRGEITAVLCFLAFLDEREVYVGLACFYSSSMAPLLALLLIVLIAWSGYVELIRCPFTLAPLGSTLVLEFTDALLFLKCTVHCSGSVPWPAP